jgi:hypothetical protein
MTLSVRDEAIRATMNLIGRSRFRKVIGILVTIRKAINLSKATCSPQVLTYEDLDELLMAFDSQHLKTWDPITIVTIILINLAITNLMVRSLDS